ncbi:MAG: LuxR C-terminal-related transcriptional regulator [Bacteriovoracaceae bacterium]
MSQIKIYILDDHTLVRNGIESLLSKNTEFHIVGSSGTVDKLEDFLKYNNEFDILLLDISLKETTSFELISKLKKEHPAIKIIILSMHDHPEYIVKSINLGSNAYLIKDSEMEDLVLVINRVYAEGTYFLPKTLNLIINYKKNTDEKNPDTFSSLTEREKEIIQFIVEGLSAKEIAVKLDISHRTVETHRFNLMKKLSINNTVDLVKMVIGSKANLDI